MKKSNREVNGEKVFRYSIRKYHFGAASVAVAALMFFANGAVKADTLPVSPATANTEKVNVGVTELTEGVPLEKSLETEGNKEIVAPEPAAETSNKEDGAGSNAQGEKEIKVSDKAVIPANQMEEINKAETNGKEKEVVTNKDKLESLLKEIDQLNLKDYTEDTVKVLQEKVAKAKEVLVNAKTQKEIDLAYNALVGYKNAGLKRVPKPKGELTPKPDTTNGKATVGIKAENTEPNGTNIAGHNHSLAGTTLSEGSGFRAAPNNENFRYETSGADLSSLVAGEELGYGKNVIIKIKYDQGTVNTRNIQFGSYPNVGPRIEYTRKYSDGIGPFEGNGMNIKLVGTLPNDMIGTYKLHLHILDKLNNNRELATLEIPITVKPKKPTVSVDDLKNAEGRMPVVRATVANTSISKVEFYLNGQKQTEVNATNGQATWTPTTALRENDRITVKNIAKGGIAPTDAYGNTFTINEVGSDMSDSVTIPKAPTPTLNKDELQNLVDEAERLKTTAAYYNAPKTNRDAYDTAISNGKTALNKSDVQQDELNTKRDAIIEAKKGLTGQATDKTALNTALSEETATKASAAYYNGTSDKKTAYDNALKAGKAVKDKANATQEEVTNAVNAINTAKQALDGQATDKTAGVTAIEAVHTVGNLDDVKATAKALPNTGTAKSTLAIPVAITSALLSLCLVGGRRKEDEEG